MQASDIVQQHDFVPADASAQSGAVSRITDEAARKIFLRDRGRQSWHPNPFINVPALASAIIVMMVKDEADIIQQNLQHHYTLGFRTFFLFDNASTDSTAAQINQFRREHPEARVFCAYDFVVGYYQAAKMQAMQTLIAAYLAHEDIPDRWVFYIDADEFLVFCAGEPPGSVASLSEALEDPSIKMLVLHWAQSASETVLAEDDPSRSIFETHSRIWTNMEPVVSKVAVRLNASLKVTQGNHAVEAFPYPVSAAAVAAASGLYMLHFPQRSVAQMRRKVVNGAAAYAAAKGQEGNGGHWRQYYEWYSQHGDVVLQQLIQAHIDSCA